MGSRIPEKPNKRRKVSNTVLFWCYGIFVAAGVCGGVATLMGGAVLKSGEMMESLLPQDREDEMAAASQQEVLGEKQMPDRQDAAAGVQGYKEQDAGTGEQIWENQNTGADGLVYEQQKLQEDAGSDTAEKPPTAVEQKRAALTFDDGPHPVYTEELLDGLKERGVCATFFVVGKNIPGNEDLIARMEAEGHLIGNHTYDHVKICDMNEADACSQVERTSALVKEITGHDTEFVRPPFGEWKKNMECSFVMIPVLWDVDPLDWTTSNTSLVVQRVVKETEDQDIILLHDYYESSVQAALQIVDILQKDGYEFVTVDELILD
ncbi:MAG: polysaccharide deacetylase family protein [Lachnospiraceae bacterium]|nr:polysaccharide deacetylase family protein [Lachnospiraceae bacterium]